MIRDYLRITPSSERLDPVSSSLQSLYKLSVRGKDSALARLNPFSSDVPVTFEFLAISEGRDEPVEFYFGSDARLDVLEQRLQTIYPASFDIDRVEVDSVQKLLRPVEYQPSELRDRLTESRLYDPEVLERRLMNNELRSSRAGTIEARPPLDEVTPRGVRWQGSVDRRKDWMTTLDGLTKRLSGGPDSGKQNATRTGRAPLVPLVDHLTVAEPPMSYQVLFRRKPDWSRQARRRSGALLAGRDTLLLKVLSLESPGPRRFGPNGYGGRRNHSNRVSSGWETPPMQGAEMRDRERNQKTTTRLDLLRENTPKRSFTVNARLLALPRTEDEIDNLEARLDNLCSAFDPIDGPYYEIDGSRFRAGALLTRRAERRAKNELEQFRTRTIDTRSSDWFPRPTNRADTRPDLILNGDELANFVIVPPMTEPSHSRDDTAGDVDPAETPEEETRATTQSAPPETGTQLQEATGLSLSDAPTAAIHRDTEIDQLTGILEPLTVGSEADAVLVTGPTGSGKTHTVKYAVDQLCQQNPGLNAVYVNCWEDHSPFQTLYRILDQLESTVDIHRKSTPRDVLIDRLRTHDDQPCVAILDEVDQLDEKDLLYDLLNLPGFLLLLIANREEDLLEGIDERLVSRLGGCERLSLDRYTVDELVDILRESTDTERIAEDLERRELEAVAEAVNGDARVAITTLKVATRRVKSESEGRITEYIVKDALPEARQEVRRNNIDGLTTHQRAVFRVIEEHERIAPGRSSINIERESRNRSQTG